VLEDNALPFQGHWTGTGAVQDSNDAENLALGAGEQMTSDIVDTGAVTVSLTLNVYAAGDSATVQYKTANTSGGIPGASWTNYTAPFASLGFVQVKVNA
jgi:hypothetical protein